MNTRTGRWETVPVPAYVGALEPETGAVLSATPAAVDAEEEHKVLVMRASSGALVVLQDRAAETAEAREMLLGGEHHGRRARGRGAAETAEARARSRGHAQQGGAAGRTRWDAAPGTEPHGLTLAWSMPGSFDDLFARAEAAGVPASLLDAHRIRVTRSP